MISVVFSPAQVAGLCANPTLSQARQYVRDARNQGKGVFGDIVENGVKKADPLILMPHEIRFLAARRPPSRYVIDLEQQGNRAGKLLHPENYYQIPNVEDRLYIPVEYEPLFERKGWTVQAAP